ncbi:hypothetical protein RQP46_008308 [Phenoliferia psychrophenolica]
MAVFHATGDRFAALKRCWSLLADGQQHINSLVESAVAHLEPTARRASDFVGYLFVFQIMSFSLLWGCHLLLDRLDGVDVKTMEALRTSSVDKVDGALLKLARHASILIGLNSEPRKDMSFSNRLVTALNRLRGPFLSRWAYHNIEAAQSCLTMVSFAAYGSPDAARFSAFTDILRRKGRRAEGPAETLVLAALTELE